MSDDSSIVFFVTGNNNKFQEVSVLFEKKVSSLKLIQSKIDLIEIQAKTLQEIALFKLNSIKNKIDGSYFVEDAGFFVDKPLNGFPGVYSSYVFKSIGNEGILKLIGDFDNSLAHFSAVIALYFKPLEKTFLFEGKIKGKVSKKIKGKGGFGFDPIFIPDELKDRTFAELSIEEKNEISHRGQAFKKLLNFLKKK